MKKCLLITDNGYLHRRYVALLREKFPQLFPLFDFRRSFTSQRAKMYEEGIEKLSEINVKTEWPSIIAEYGMVFSLHCKQIFPPELVRGVQCINIHPGYNPINRGWYPQVFAINEGTVIGVTIHEMDEEIDRGKIIARQRVPIFSTDTSIDVYERVLDAEILLLEQNLLQIVENRYKAFSPETEGVYHSRKDFLNLCQLDVEKVMPLKQAINLLRSLTHGAYPNAYFIDENGDKVFVKILLSKAPK